MHTVRTRTRAQCAPAPSAHPRPVRTRSANASPWGAADASPPPLEQIVKRMCRAGDTLVRIEKAMAAEEDIRPIIDGIQDGGVEDAGEDPDED